MIESLKARVGIVIASIVLAIIWVLPNFADFGEGWWFSTQKLVYGLDIQGGLHLVMGVDTEGVIREKASRIARGFKSELEEKKIRFRSVELDQKTGQELTVSLESAADVAAVQAHIDELYATTLQVLNQTGLDFQLKIYDARIREFKEQILSQSIEVIRNRIDEFGVAEPSISAQGDDRILVQLPGIKDSTKAKELVNRTARMVFRIVGDEVSPAALAEMIQTAETEGGYALGKDGMTYSAYVARINADLKAKLPPDRMVAFEKAENAATMDVGKIPYLLKTDQDLGGELLEDAFVGPDEYGNPQVNFRFGTEGRRMFSALTGANVKKQMAILLDDVVQSAPVIQGQISSNSAVITLNQRNYQESLAEANFIATALRAGALPAALQQLEERTVGPTLGADSINKGKTAGIVGLLLVFVFMLVYYKKLGIVADIVLGLNMLMILAVLTSLGATLTLPGVAGLVLTIGMAVDANVIIFERIKEELKKGAGLRIAIKDGFGNALSAIVDSNITTVITCVVLIYFGSGPVRGFGVTLIIGIITSMYTAVFVSRVILDLMVNKFNVQKIA